MIEVKYRKGGCKPLLLASAAALVAGVSPAIAQQASPDAAGPKSGLNEVIVTARRVAENVQKVPITVNVLTAASLKQKGVEQLSQIDGLVPNVVYEDRGGAVHTNISIRGIQSNQTNTGIDPGVGFYLDGVYQPDGIGFNQDLLDVASIEVLKGPQGTLFGRNTIAGVVSVQTRQPVLNDFFAQGSVIAGSYQLNDDRAVVNLPISSIAALTLSGVYRYSEGYDTNIVDHAHVNGEDHYGGRAQLRVVPNDNFNVLASAYYFKDDAPQELARCGGRILIPGSCPPASDGGHVIASNGPNSTERVMWGGAVTMHWNVGDWGTVTSITAYQHLDASELQDESAVSVNLLHSGFQVPLDNTFSQEIRLATPQDKPLRGVIGGYFSNEDKVSNTPLTLTPTLLGFIGVPGPSITGPSYVETFGHQGIDSTALFGQGQYDVTPQLTLEGGLRYTLDEKSFRFSQQVSGTNDCIAHSLDPYCPFPRFRGNHSWGALSGTASVSYRVTDNLMTYVRYSRGYKSGGWNGTELSPGTNPTIPFGPEYVDMVEGGAKFETQDHKLRLNGAIFYNNYTNIQSNIHVPLTGEQYITNAGDAWTDGLELEATWAPIAGLELNGNLGLESTKIYKVAPSSGLNSLLNAQFPLAPKVSASVTAAYTRPVTDKLDGMVSVTDSYRSGEYLNNGDTVPTAEMNLVSARIGVQAANGRWGLYVTGKNLTKVSREVYFVGDAPWTTNIGYYNAPQTFEVELDGKF